MWPQLSRQVAHRPHTAYPFFRYQLYLRDGGRESGHRIEWVAATGVVKGEKAAAALYQLYLRSAAARMPRQKELPKDFSSMGRQKEFPWDF